MNNQKNIIIAVVLSTAFLMIWNELFVRPQIEKKQESVKQQQLDKKQEQAQNQGNNSKESAKAVNTQITKPKNLPEIRIPLENDHITGSFLVNNMRIDQVTLKDYQVSIQKNAANVKLLSPSNTDNSYFFEFGWIDNSNNLKLPNINTPWVTQGNKLTPDTPVKLSWDNSEGLIFNVKISIDNDYMVKYSQSITNNSDRSVTISPYGRINRVKKFDSESFFILHEGMIGEFNGVLEEVRYEDLIDERKLAYSNSTGWIGITDKYWLTAMIPDRESDFNGAFKYNYKNNKSKFQADYFVDPHTLPPTETISYNNNLYVGAKKLNLLDKYGKELDLELFDRAVDFGWLYFITKPIFKALTFFNSMVGNFGVAILLLTVVIKFLLFPLANKSYVSMHGMKKIQPKMLELKDRYKDDKIQLQKEVMELYKKEKVNPLSGCLPILLQLPIFFALYKVLFVSIEMRHAPFFGWINDLSAPDPTSIFNLFGLIPWDPPNMLMIGVWPIIMGLSMILQQKMSPPPADPVQAKVMKLLPFIFLFLFATFPAGLVIYWAWNNILSILQQWLITRKLD